MEAHCALRRLWPNLDFGREVVEGFLHLSFAVFVIVKGIIIEQGSEGVRLFKQRLANSAKWHAPDWLTSQACFFDGFDMALSSSWSSAMALTFLGRFSFHLSKADL